MGEGTCPAGQSRVVSCTSLHGNGRFSTWRFAGARTKRSLLTWVLLSALSERISSGSIERTNFEIRLRPWLPGSTTLMRNGKRRGDPRGSLAQLHRHSAVRPNHLVAETMPATATNSAKSASLEPLRDSKGWSCLGRQAAWRSTGEPDLVDHLA